MLGDAVKDEENSGWTLTSESIAKYGHGVKILNFKIPLDLPQTPKAQPLFDHVHALLTSLMKEANQLNFPKELTQRAIFYEVVENDTKMTNMSSQ